MLKKHLIAISIVISFSSLNLLIAQMPQVENIFGSESYFNAGFIYELGLLKKADLDLNKLIISNLVSSTNDKEKLLEIKIELSEKNYQIAESKINNFLIERSNSPLIPFAAYERALMFFSQKNFERAEYYFEQTRKLSEEDFAARNDENYKVIAYNCIYWRAVCLSILGKYIEAKPIFEDLVLRFPKSEYSDDALFALGQIAENNSNYEDAIVYYKKIRGEYPNSNSYISALIREANNNIILRNPSSATLLLERADATINGIDKNDSNYVKYENQSYSNNSKEQILYLRGESANLSKNFKQASLFFKTFIETYKQSNLINLVKLAYGWALLNLNEYNVALKYYDEVINKTSEKEWKAKSLSQLYRIITLKKLNNIDQAKKELSALSIISNYPYLAQALIEQGQLYYEEKDYSNARKSFERADREAQEPVSTVRAKVLLGATYMELLIWDKAIFEYREAYAMANNTPEIFMPEKKFYMQESKLKEGIALVQNQKSNEAITALSNFVANGEKDSRLGEGLFWLAESYYRSDMLTNSIQTCESILEKDLANDRREEVFYTLGWSYFRKKNFNQSSKVFDKLINEFPKSKFAAEVLSRQGDGYYVIKNYIKAAEAYSRASKINESSEESQYAAYQLCHAQYRAGKSEPAITSLLDYIRKYNRSSLAPNAMYLIGWIRFQQKRFNEAVDNFKYLLEAYPQSGLVARSHYAIADAYFNQSSYEKAMKEYKYVIDNYPNSDLAPEAMRGVQQCLVLQGRDDEAVEIINNFTEKNQDSPFFRDFKEKAANILFDNRKYKDAITEYEKILQKYPDSQKNAESIYWIGKSYASMGNYSEAESSFINLQKKFPISEEAPLGMLENALMQKKQSDIRKADSILLSLSKLYPEHSSAPQASFERAVMKSGIGDTNNAMNIYYFVADSFPNSEYSVESRYRIARYLKNKNMTDSARKEYLKLADTKGNPEIASESRYRVGELYLRDNNPDSALIHFEIVKEKFSGMEDWFSLSLLSLGEIYEGKSQKNKAIEIYNSLIALRPDDDFGKTAKQRLKRMN